MPKGSDATRVTTVVGVILLVAGVGLTFALFGAMAANGDAAPLAAAIVGPVLVAAMSLAADWHWAGRRDSAQLARQEVFRAYVRQAARADMAKELARLSKLRAKGELSEEEFQVLRSHYEVAVATAHNPILLPSWGWRAR